MDRPLAETQDFRAPELRCSIFDSSWQTFALSPFPHIWTSQPFLSWKIPDWLRSYPLHCESHVQNSCHTASNLAKADMTSTPCRKISSPPIISSQTLCSSLFLADLGAGLSGLQTGHTSSWAQGFWVKKWCLSLAVPGRSWALEPVQAQAMRSSQLCCGLSYRGSLQGTRPLLCFSHDEVGLLFKPIGNFRQSWNLLKKSWEQVWCICPESQSLTVPGLPAALGWASWTPVSWNN